MKGEHAEGWPELCGVGRTPGKQKAHSFLIQCKMMLSKQFPVRSTPGS